MTGDKIIPFSVRECQRHAKGSTGVAAAVAGINVRIVDHAAQATAAAGRLPTPGPREPGGLGALQKGVSEEYLLNETQEHLPPACLAYPRIHSSGPCLSWPWPGPRASAEGPGEFASGAFSRGTHLIPFNSFWAFSTLGRFITFSGDG